MDRSNQVVIIAGILAGVVVLAAFIVGFNPTDPMDSPSFTWAAQTNDTLTYQITVYRDDTYFVSESIPRYDELNHTLITINITSLGDVQEITNETQFTMMVETEKITIMLPIRHENGSEVTVQAELVRSIISKCILPVGGWSFVDDYYSDLDDPDDYGYWCSTYFSYAELNTFVFGHLDFNLDAGNGWRSTMNTTTGLPSIIDWWHEDFIMHEYYQIIMTLILS